MTYDYAADAAAALEALTEFGQNVTRRAYTVGTYDPSTGAATTTTADTTRKGVVIPFGAGQTLERGTLIQGADKRLLLDASGTVEAQDHFVIGGVEYVVVSFDPLSPGGVVCLYDIHLRT